MVRPMMRALVAALVATWLCGGFGDKQAEAAHPDIFYNYYNGPTVFGQGTPAQLYVSPRPTPPMVGHTWITYPPLNPHEFLYHHKRHYYKYYRGGGYTTSKVRYSSLW